MISSRIVNSGKNGTSSYYVRNARFNNLDVPQSLNHESNLLSNNFGLQESLRQLDFENGRLAGLCELEGSGGFSKSGRQYEKTRRGIVEQMNLNFAELMLFVKSHSILARGLSCNEMGKIFSLLGNNVEEKVVLVVSKFVEV